LIEDSLGKRLRSLVEQVHAGSVNAAARDLGVAQQTLGRIIDGTVENPRSRLLQKVAEFYGVSIDWLLTGEGAPPQYDPAEPTSDMARWRGLINSLEPSSDLRTALEGLPLSVLTACVIVEAGLRKPRQADTEDESRRIASGLEYEAWTTALTRWISIGGEKRVKAQLENCIPEIKVGFTPSALRSQQKRRDQQRSARVAKRN